MLLSVERVLKMLSEGKSSVKIAETANVSVEDVYAIIEDALKIVMETDRPRARKKVIIRRERSDLESGPSGGAADEIFTGAELSAVPLDSALTMYTDGASRGNPGPAGIGIVIFDDSNRQVGKISRYIGVQTNNYAEYTAVIKAVEIASYFKAKRLKIRTDSELVVKQINGEYKVKNDNIRPLYERVKTAMRDIEDIKIEHVTRNLNDKADHLAKKATESRGLQ